MPANTAKGYPYPLGTDRVMDGDDAIHNLAQAIDDNLGRVAAGQVTTPTPSAINVPVSVAVTFPVGRFNATPSVVAQYNGTLASRQGQASGTTVSGCVIWGWQSSGTLGAIAVGWIAVQI